MVVAHAKERFPLSKKIFFPQLVKSFVHHFLQILYLLIILV